MHVIYVLVLFFTRKFIVFHTDQVIVQGSRKMRVQQRIKQNDKVALADHRQHQRQRQQRQQEKRRHQQQRRWHQANRNEHTGGVNGEKNVSIENKTEHMHRERHRGKRSISSPRHVEALIVADPSMVAFHQDGDVETYLLTIMNMVSSLYKDPAIGNLIKVVVVRIVLLEEDETQSDFNVTHLAENNLHNFCRYDLPYIYELKVEVRSFCIQCINILNSFFFSFFVGCFDC